MKGDLCCTLRAGMLRVTIGPSVFEDMERNNIYGGGKSVRRRFRFIIKSNEGVKVCGI